MARKRTGARRIDRLPSALRPLVGSVVLVAGVKLVDALWTRLGGRRPPAEAAPSEPGAGGDTAPALVRDRVLYALLLGGVMRLAERAGLTPAGRRGRRG
jgi:hypothetical protein